MKEKTLEKKENRENPLIYIDQRETSSRIGEELERKGAEVKKKQLEVGDYIASDRVAIERKTYKDLIDSIIDKRLFEQAENLKEEFEKPIIIIEGIKKTRRNIHPNAIKGALASIAIDYEIPILNTTDKQETASLIQRIAHREQIKQKRNNRVKGKRTPLMLSEQQLHLVQSLPGVGPELAKALLKKFKNIKNLVNASKSQMKDVEGIGEKKTRKIRKVLNEEWKEKE